jgi:hypothetical protein
MRAFGRSLGAAIALLCFAPGALAQNQERVDVYHFEDDALIGDTWGTTPPLIRVRAEKLPRVMLLRPRAAFVAELLKSVEML